MRKGEPTFQVIDGKFVEGYRRLPEPPEVYKEVVIPKEKHVRNRPGHVRPLKKHVKRN